MSSATDTSSSKDRVVICIGDLHGYISKLRSLWSNLQSRLPESAFESALVIFLGDYCDRGPDTRLVLDFLISLPSRYPEQTHVFLCGNHDFAFAAFVGALPPPPDGSPFSATWAEFQANAEREGWFKGTGYENMHVQGRRWGGRIKDRFNAKKGMDYKGSIYDAAPTFESYGVPHGSPDLAKAVPEDHKVFLLNLVWIHEEDNVWIEDSKGKHCCKLIAVHAGLEKAKGFENQLKQLKAKDTSIQKVEALSGRKNVWEIPKELIETPTIIVSGHHGELHIEGLRLIIDEGGGLEQNPVAAIILPTMEIVRDTDVLPAGK
ncbi:hypothetical protein H6P81_015785 [Aristolochia fimbriata]|uniref:Calcineurin-like phosphoesterase domain-containing protein n=1 Tax=Aristolochia fimbriata TaxID=158543 RepID=A0AAV7E8L9_ARIFI|nr:hypothetical protein H6P81_015785 [Aristolochia fimbriata]